MKPVALSVRPEAEPDILEAASRYEDQLEGLGERFLLDLETVFEHIGDNPRRFPKILAAVHRALLRRFPYSVYFEIEEETAVVIAVLHQSRQLGLLEERRK